MPLSKLFWEQLPQKTDIELHEMLAHQDDYQPEALAAAKEELEKRNLPFAKTAELGQLTRKNKLAEDSKAEQRLTGPKRVLLFLSCLMGFILIVAAIAIYLDLKGYKRKASDCWIVLGTFLASMVFLGVLIFGYLALTQR